METYLEKLLSQIRCKKARPFIEEEIRSHIECQIEANQLDGMSYEEAEDHAIADMGDPVSVGISLDRIHKPRMAWNLVFIVGLISMLAVLVHFGILCKINSGLAVPIAPGNYRETFVNFVVAVVVGFGLMGIIYFIDFTVLAKYAKFIAVSILAVEVLRLFDFFGGDVNGLRYSIGIGPLSISATALMMFYVPIYGAILYKYRDGGIGAFISVLVWMILPVIITFEMPNIVVTGMILLSMVIQLTAAVWKGWFRLPIKRTIAIIWGGFAVLPVASLVGMYVFGMLKAYQTERIRAFLAGSGDGFYLTNVLRNICRDSVVIGKSGVDVIESVPDFNGDLIFTYILGSYGILAGVGVIALMVVLVIAVFGTSVRQKNELGMVMGFGCGMIFALNIVINILSAVGAIPYAASFLPFLSMGRSNILLCYALVGIMLSIYRYKDVYPKKIHADKITIKKNFTIHI